MSPLVERQITMMAKIVVVRSYGPHNLDCIEKWWGHIDKWLPLELPISLTF
jgi:hypothetical protein